MSLLVRLPVTGLLFAITATVLTGLLSAVPWRPEGADRSLLRLSWRATGGLVEECRRPSEEENARLPAHMRREEICEGRTTSFFLGVTINGQTVVADTVAASGARGDRPVYVFREVVVPPGTHDVSVRFETLLPGTGEPVRENGFPSLLRRDERIRLEAGDIVLITYDAVQRALVSRSR